MRSFAALRMATLHLHCGGVFAWGSGVLRDHGAKSTLRDDLPDPSDVRSD